MPNDLSVKALNSASNFVKYDAPTGIHKVAKETPKFVKEDVNVDSKFIKQRTDAPEKSGQIKTQYTNLSGQTFDVYV